eukprot:752370-Hanusia_phi.AAC.1
MPGTNETVRLDVHVVMIGADDLVCEPDRFRASFEFRVPANNERRFLFILGISDLDAIESFSRLHCSFEIIGCLFRFIPLTACSRRSQRSEGLEACRARAEPRDVAVAHNLFF